MARRTVTTKRQDLLQTHNSQGISRNGEMPGKYYDNAVTQEANDHGLIKIFHVPSGIEINFPAFLTDFKDDYKTDYQKETVFGRMDPITTFKSIQRNISIGFTVPAASIEEARKNMMKINALISCLYPIYDREGGFPGVPSSGGATTIKGGPLFKIKFANLITSEGAPGGYDVEHNGLPGIIDGFSYDPIIDEGIFDEHVDGAWTGFLYPQSIRASFNFSVLHQQKLGWNDDGSWRDPDTFGQFPYATGVQRRYDHESGQDPWENADPTDTSKWRASAACEDLDPIDMDMNSKAMRACALPQPLSKHRNIDEMYDMLADNIQQSLDDGASNFNEQQVESLRAFANQHPDGVLARRDSDIWGDQLDERVTSWVDLQTDLLKARMQVKVNRMLGSTVGGWAGELIGGNDATILKPR